jgi:uncharacterized membrane protein YccF (DUF307 family)
MRVIGNIIWIVFGGFLIFLEYIISGILLCLTIIGIPFGLQCLKLSFLALVPFGKEVAPARTDSGFVSIVMNILWIILGGFWIAVSHVLLAVFFTLTIIGIPFAIQHIKLAALGLTPFGKRICTI